MTEINVTNEKNITLCAYAKINLFLDITGVRPDGYHTITGVMHNTLLCDHVMVSVAPRQPHIPTIRLTCDNPDLPTDRKNLGYRAAEAFLKAMAREEDSPLCIEIDIKKRIPAAAGMAGGSTDAAAVLRGLNILLDEPLDEETLRRVGLTLGADVPFCLAGGTQITEGIGEKLSPLPTLPYVPMVVACGGEGVSTPQAYQALDQMYNRFDGTNYAPKYDKLTAQLQALQAGDIAGVAQNAYNIFEEVVLPHHPVARKIKLVMQEHGAMLSMMSGSGPSVFGFFPTPTAAIAVANTLKEMGISAWAL